LKKAIQDVINSKSSAFTLGQDSPIHVLSPNSTYNLKDKRIVFSEGRIDSRNAQART